MNTTLNTFRKGKFLSFLTLLCVAFSFVSGFRYYINESVYAAFDLGNLGEFGKELKVSVLVAVFAALGWAIGLLAAFLTEKKKINAVTLYWLSGLFAIVALFFNPYNLQLLMPDTIMQNIAMIACIAHVVFILVDAFVFAWAVSAGSKEVLLAVKGKIGIAVVISSAAVATVFAFVSLVFKWSFVIQTAVCGGILTAVNVLHAAFPEKESEVGADAEATRTYSRIGMVAVAVVTLLFAAVLIGAYFITENLMSLS